MKDRELLQDFVHQELEPMDRMAAKAREHAAESQYSETELAWKRLDRHIVDCMRLLAWNTHISDEQWKIESYIRDQLRNDQYISVEALRDRAGKALELELEYADVELLLTKIMYAGRAEATRGHGWIGKLERVRFPAKIFSVDEGTVLKPIDSSD
jgi:hypothetical protein